MSNAATSNKRPRILIAMANWFSSRTCRRKHGFPREMPFDTWFKVRSEKYNSIFTVFKCFSGPNVLFFVWLIMHRCATRFQFMGAHFTNMVAFCKYGRFLQIWKQRRLVTAPLNFFPNIRQQMSRRFKYSANLIHRYTNTIKCPLCQCDREIFRVSIRVDKKGRDRVRELLAHFGGKHYNSISSKKFGYIFRKKILCGRALLFPLFNFHES